MTEKHTFYFMLALIAVSSAACIFFISQWGFGTSPDSIIYIAGARSLAAGRGFSLPSVAGDPSPIVQFPPLFSAVLSTFGLVGIDPLDGASILNAALFALNIYLAGLFVYRVTGMREAGFIAGALTLTAPAILATHTMVWSEALFLFLVLTSGFATVRYLRQQNYSALLTTLPAALLAPLTRYVGVAVLIAVFCTIARKNVRHGAAFTLAASLGIGGWLMRNHFLTAGLTDRKIVFHPPTSEQLALAAQTVLEWFGGLLLAVVFVGLLVITMLRRPQQNGTPQESTFLMDFALTYAGVLALSILFADAHTPLDRRILSPLYLAFSLYTVMWVACNTTRPLRLAWRTLAVLVLGLNSWTSIVWLSVLSNQGIGFSNSLWRSSPTIQFLKSHRSMPMHTNAPDPIFLLVGTPAAMIPRHTDPGTRARNPDYDNQMAQVKISGGTVVYFRTVTWRTYLPHEDRLQTELGLSRIADLGDGAVYAIRSVSR
jgi:hypothetical protein